MRLNKVIHSQSPPSTNTTTVTPRPHPLSSASRHLGHAVRSARQFFQQLPASLQSTVKDIRTAASTVFAKLEKPVKTAEQQLTRLRGDHQLQSRIGQLAGTGALQLDITQAAEAFRRLTEPNCGVSNDARVNAFVGAFDQQIDSLLGSGADRSLARSIVAGQVIARCVIEHNPASATAQDCSNALSSYLANPRPGMQHHEGFVQLMKQILAPPA